MLSGKQLAALPRPVRAYVMALTKEEAWQQIHDLLQESPEKQLAIASVVASNCDKAGRSFLEISVAKSQ